MKRRMLGPCDSWAVQLAAAHSTDLAPAERAALAAHLASCPVCAAVRADYRRMDVQIRRLPDPEPLIGLPPRLLQLWAEEDHRAGLRQFVALPRAPEALMQTTPNAGASSPAPAPSHHERRSARRMISGVTAIAAVLIIAFVTIALLASHTGKPSNTGTGNAPATPPPGSQGWQSVPGLTNLPVQPAIAPSNPQVIYEASAHPIVLRRSDDGGAHWTNLSQPARMPQADDALLQINSGNAQNIFLVLTFPQSSSACSGTQASNALFNAYSGNSCQIEYYSIDGGAHWDLTRWGAQTSEPGAVVVAGLDAAQGNRLYSLIYDFNQTQHQRLIASTDDGATWQYADQALRAQGQGICNFAATSTGSTVFAFAQSGYCAQAVGYRASNALYSQASSGVAIWRSDDAGADWTEVAGFPYQQPDTQSLRAVNFGGAQPTLFAAAGQGSTYTRVMSTDGGRTWQPLPTQGIPASGSVFGFFGTTLSDGSLLAGVQVEQNSPASFYAWKPGEQAWHQVAPALAGFPIDPIVVSSAGGHDTLWVVVSTDKGFTIWHYTLK